MKLRVVLEYLYMRFHINVQKEQYDVGGGNSEWELHILQNKCKSAKP